MCCNHSNWWNNCGCHRCGCHRCGCGCGSQSWECGCTGWTPYGGAQAATGATSACGCTAAVTSDWPVCGCTGAAATDWPACAVDWSGFQSSGCGCNG